MTTEHMHNWAVTHIAWLGVMGTVGGFIVRMACNTTEDCEEELLAVSEAQEA